MGILGIAVIEPAELPAAVLEGAAAEPPGAVTVTVTVTGWHLVAEVERGVSPEGVGMPVG